MRCIKNILSHKEYQTLPTLTILGNDS